MFPLERAIADWRRRMTAAGIKTPVTLEELENHLRDDFDRRVQSGMSAEQAFEVAVQSIGQPAALRGEFAKVGATTGTRLQRLKRALLGFLGVPQLSPATLTAGARKTLELGGQAALGFHHDFVGTEHVLLGLLGTQTEVVTGVLRRLGVGREEVRSEIERIVGIGQAQGIASAPPFTPRAKKALELAGREARAQNQGEISAEHIFLGLLLEGGGVAALVLKSLGVNAKAVREEILREPRRNQPGA